MALLTVSQDLGVFGWGDDSQIFRDILSLPIMCYGLTIRKDPADAR
jgi:hypothetical protein